MAPSIGTAADVLVLIDNMTGKSTAQIEEILEQCEDFYSVVLKIPSSFTFNAATYSHKMLRLAVETKAALLCITVSSCRTLEQAAIVMDSLYDQYKDCLKFMADSPGYISFIKEQ